MFQQRLNRYSSPKGSILFYEPIATPDRRGPLNVGLQVISGIAQKNGYDVDYCFFDGIKKGFRTLSGRDIKEFDVVAVSIMYHLQALNLWPFLKQTTDKQIKIIGGSACYNHIPFSEFFDYVFVGDSEGTFDEFLRRPLREIRSQAKKDTGNKEFHGEEFYALESAPMVQHRSNGRTAYIEINRGCRFKCKFCYLSWTRRFYSEKNLILIKKQIDWALRKGMRQINFCAASFFSHSQAEAIINYCIERRVHMMNSDFRVDKILEFYPLLRRAKPKSINTGIESFTGKALQRCNKGFSTSEVERVVELLNKDFTHIHYYLIYGLPWSLDEDLLEFIRLSESLRKANVKKNVINYSITSFEPSFGTPYENEKQVDFQKKRLFDGKLKAMNVPIWASKGEARYRAACYLMNSRKSEVDRLKAIGDLKLCLNRTFKPRIWDLLKPTGREKEKN